MPAAPRLSDFHESPITTDIPPLPHVGGPVVGPGEPDLLPIDLPEARVGDMLINQGPPDALVDGATAETFNDLPAASLGDSTAHGGEVVLGDPTVMIGK